MTKAVSKLVWILAAGVLAGTGYSLFNGFDRGNGLVDTAAALAWLVFPVAFAVTAAFIVSRQPTNAVGWLLMIPAVSSVAASIVTQALASITTAPANVSLWLVAALAFDNFGWILFIYPVFHLLLVFPSGGLLGKPWRSVAALEVAMVTTMITLSVFGTPTGPFDESWKVENPIGFLSTTIFNSGLFTVMWTAGLVLITVAGVTSMTKRFRHAQTVERQQIKWLFYAVTMFGVVYTLAAIFSDFSTGGVFDLLLPITLINIAVAIAIAVLRYRLFEIDRVISRTVGYAVVVALLALVYAAGAVWLPSRLTGESPLFVAGSTLAAAALFNPLRRRVLHAVDRRFYRARYNAEKVIEEFAVHLRSQTDVHSLTRDWVAVVTETMQPSSVGVWLNNGGGGDPTNPKPAMTAPRRRDES